ALFFGDWDRALDEYLLALNQSPDPAIHAAAQLGLGRTHYQREDYAASLDALRLAAQTAPDDLTKARASFILGMVYDALQRYTEAADAYNSYLTLLPGTIDHYAHLRRADSLFAAGEYTLAISAYQQALASPQLGDGLDINIKIGDAYSQLGDHNTALVVYRDVRDRTTNDFTKSQMQLYIGQAHVALGSPELANQAWSFTVTNYPISYYTYLALVEMVEAGLSVDDFERGLVDYYVARNFALSGDVGSAITMYGLALEAFNRYLADFPEDHSDAIHFYRGLSLRSLEDYPAAIAEFDQIILTHQGDRFWVDAWDEKAYTQWVYQDDHPGAAQTLLDFITTTPTNPRAPEFLFLAGRILEISGDLASAAAIWSRVGVEYPQSDYAADGFFLAGISRYRQGLYLEALDDFRSSLVVSHTPTDQARSHLWSGKTLQLLGESGEANLSFQVAASTDPTGYYSERAQDLIEGRGPFTSGVYDLTHDLLAERQEAAEWVKNAFALSADVDLFNSGPLASDPRFGRGTEL
ncbi:MAG: tetratricopeptide repeat protein, partial [Anaerolineae bacterium]|nr:tetratricopeptide repeat protein [Anaerolineae bacterium]